jgi:hypothetical protein
MTTSKNYSQRFNSPAGKRDYFLVARRGADNTATDTGSDNTAHNGARNTEDYAADDCAYHRSARNDYALFSPVIVFCHNCLLSIYTNATASQNLVFLTKNIIF